MLTEQSVAKTYCEQEIQTDNHADKPSFYELSRNDDEEFTEEKNNLIHKVNELTEHINEL